jgi:protein involved in polysaccharide export with SLBB domain
MRCHHLNPRPGFLMLISMMGLFGGCVSPSEHRAHFADLPPAGFSSTGSVSGKEVVKAGDIITFDFSAPSDAAGSNVIEAVVRQHGTITLPSNQVFQAAGKTMKTLDREIRVFYGPQFVQLPPWEHNFYTVGGEVCAPNSYSYLGPTTVFQAIESAGGLTAAARRSKIRLKRSGQTYLINYTQAWKDPTLDREVFPGDQIMVHRSFWK